MSRSVLVTGAAGNIGAKITTHLRGKGYDLRLLDKAQGPDIEAADFGIWDEAWARRFAGVDTVVHLAGNPHGTANWASAKRDNINGTQHVLRAAREAKVRRVIFASTNQVMLGYRFKIGPVTVDMPPAPLSPYGISKFACEEIGRAFTEETGIEFLALRIGYFQRGENLPGAHLKIGEWGQSMWLSNRDMNQAIEKAIEAPPFGFDIVFLMSHNDGMRWDLDHTRDVIGYVPLDRVTPVMLDANRAEDATARAVRMEPGTWFDEHLHAVTP
jgi:uronate dehydrogenase